MQGHEGCLDWLTPNRAQGVHDLMTKLLGRCTCQSSTTRVHHLYAVAGAAGGEDRESA